METEELRAPEISVVIPCRDASTCIGGQLTALARQEWTGDWEVIVADNGSSDSTAEVVGTFDQRLPRLRFVPASERRGAAHARNVGAGRARGRSIIFCDADDEVAEGWLAAMAAALRDSAFVASRFDLKKLNPETIAASRGDPQHAGLQVLDYPPYLSHSGGSGLGIRRALFAEVGGFDESLRFVQDTDFCIRVQLAGTPLSFAPDALVHVRLPVSNRRQFRQAYRWAKSNSRIYKRYRPTQHRLHRPWRNYLIEIRHLLKGARALRRPRGRARWVFRAGWDLGLGAAAIEYRMPPMIYSALLQPQVSGPTPQFRDDVASPEGSA